MEKKKEVSSKEACATEKALLACLNEVAAAPEEATPTLTAPPPQLLEKEPEEATPTLTAPPPLLVEKEPEAPEKCYKKTVGEEATFLEVAKDYFNQFKAMPAQKHWICVKNYFSHKCSSVFGNGKTKVQPVVKDENPEMAKPAQQ